MSLHGPEATGAATLTSSRLRIAGVHLRNTSGLDREGIARAQQLAGIAAGDTARQDMAEQALADLLADPAQLSMLDGISLCHGRAGLFQTLWHAAHDARTPALTASLPHLAALLTQHSQPPAAAGTGLLEGQAGLALALLTAASNTPPASGWDRCLLIA